MRLFVPLLDRKCTVLNVTVVITERVSDKVLPSPLVGDGLFDSDDREGTMAGVDLIDVTQ